MHFLQNKKELIHQEIMAPIANYIQSYGRFQRNARLYLLSYALSGITTGIILVLYNLYLAALGYSTAFIGGVIFAAALGAGLAIFPAGLSIDRFGGKAVLIWGSVEIGVAGAGQILFHQPVPLVISAFFVGIGGAFVTVVNAPFLTLNSSPDERPQLFSLAIVVSLVTTVVGELIGGVLPLWFRSWNGLMAPLPTGIEWLLVSQPLARSYQLTLLFAGIIAVPSFIPLFLMQNNRPVPSSGSQMPSSRERFRTLLKGFHTEHPRMLLQNPLLVITAIYTLLGAGAGLFLPYANLYFVQHLGASSALFGVIDASANTLNALATLGAPWVALRIGKLRTLTLTRLLSLPVQLLLGFTTLLPLAAFLYPLRQGLMDMSVGLLQVFSMEEVPKRRRGLANSTYQAAFQGIQALTTPLGGIIIARSGFAPVFVGGAVMYLLAISLLWICFGRGESPREILSADESERQQKMRGEIEEITRLPAE